jgi:hypothetical protein
MFGLNFGITSSSGGGVAAALDFENALQLDGVNDYVNFTEQTYVQTVFSASFWIRYTTVNTNRIIFGSDSNSNRYFRLDSATQFSMRTRSAGGSIDTFTVPTLSAGQWYHVAVSLDNGTNLLWVNGNQYSSNASVNYAAETVAVGRIGGRSNTTQMTEAIIDDFIIQSTVLDQTEVDSIYNSGAGNLPTTVFSNSDVYFKFDESSGTSTADSSGNNNTGTLNNFTGAYYFVPHSYAYPFMNALQFDGVNDYVSIGSSVSVSAEATVNMWVKFSDLNTRLVSDTSNTAVIWTPTSTSVRVYCGGGFRDFVVPTMSLGTWYMITATRDASSGWRVYLNGTESTSGLQVRAGTFNVDRLGNLGSVYSDIVLDELSILDGTTASDIQIKSLYNFGDGADANTALGSTSLYYKFNESSGTSVADSSGNGNTGTLNNFTGIYFILQAIYNFGNYIQPDGVNDTGELNSQITLGTSTDWVVSFWVKGSGSSNTTNTILSNRTSSGYYSYLRTGATPYVRWSFGANNTRHDWSQSALSGWDDNAWHHVYFYNVVGAVHLVFDGVDYGDGTATATQNGVRIRDFFYRQVTNSIHSKVAMDDFIAHEITGSVAQAQSLYNSGAGENPFSVFGATPQYRYKFDVANTATTTIPNSGSAGSNDLTLSNFTGAYLLEHTFSPIDLSPLFWMNASAGVTESGGAVSAWADQSGNSNDFSQSSGSLQPTYDATGLNGLPTIIFNNKELVSGVLSSQISNITVYCVWKMDTNYNGGTIMGQTTGANNKRFFWYDPEDSIYYWDGGTSSKILAASNDPLVSAEAFVIRSDSNGDGEGRVNNDAFSAENNVQGLTTDDAAMTIGNRGAGAARRLQGRISQLIVYQGEHTDAQVNNVMNYLNGIYSIW